jgi:hypothetical protein
VQLRPGVTANTQDIIVRRAKLPSIIDLFFWLLRAKWESYALAYSGHKTSLFDTKS